MFVLKYIWARLGETSTWISIGIAATAVASSLGNQQTLPVALFAGFMAVILPERKDQ